MLTAAINGKFLSDRMQGIVRYARELVVALDDVLDENDRVVLVVPPDAQDVPAFSHIEVVQWGRLKGIAWEQLDFARYLRKHKGFLSLNLCNVAPIVAPAGVTTVHDVMYRTCPEFYTSPRNKTSRLWHCAQYRFLAWHELMLLTVSAYSKAEIERCYPHSRGKVRVVPNGWQHVCSYVEATDWQERYPELIPGEYLFSMATLARNKNVRWIYEVARRNPDVTFAIAGMRYETDGVSHPSNVRLLGFVPDDDACALIRNCKAFLYPSLYEGFGLPPLEALALGAQVISSNATSLPEVLCDAVHYVDPRDYEVDIDVLLGEPVGPARHALDAYSWHKSGKLLVQALQEALTSSDQSQVLRFGAPKGRSCETSGVVDDPRAVPQRSEDCLSTDGHNAARLAGPPHPKQAQPKQVVTT